MHFESDNLYHIYNRGNNQQIIYHNRENYTYFLKKVHKYIKPRCSILAWCLMPTHFHLLVFTDERSCNPVSKALTATQHLTEGIRLLLSSFSKGINKQEQTTGNVFQQKTKAKCVANYDHIAFHYIHQNALTAGMVQQMEAYEFSSFPDYVNLRKGTLCDKALAFKLLGLKEETFYEASNKMLEAGSVGKIF